MFEERFITFCVVFTTFCLRAHVFEHGEVPKSRKGVADGVLGWPIEDLRLGSIERMYPYFWYHTPLRDGVCGRLQESAPRSPLFTRSAPHKRSNSGLKVSGAPDNWHYRARCFTRISHVKRVKRVNRLRQSAGLVSRLIS